MPTWVQIKLPNGKSKLVPKEQYIRPGNKVHHIMLDIEPYRATAGQDAGKYITSRSKEREYLKRNNCVQVGNEKDYFFKYNGKTDDNPTREW